MPIRLATPQRSLMAASASSINNHQPPLPNSVIPAANWCRPVFPALISSPDFDIRSALPVSTLEIQSGLRVAAGGRVVSGLGVLLVAAAMTPLTP
jgi:hypothetical protein